MPEITLNEKRYHFADCPKCARRYPGERKNMRPENKRMRDFLLANGIDAIPKWISTGSLKRSWRLYGKNGKNTPENRLADYQLWTLELAAKLTTLGFRGLHGPLGRWDGNGGVFSVFVRGHEELVNQ